MWAKARSPHMRLQNNKSYVCIQTLDSALTKMIKHPPKPRLRSIPTYNIRFIEHNLYIKINYYVFFHLKACQWSKIRSVNRKESRVNENFSVFVCWHNLFKKEIRIGLDMDFEVFYLIKSKGYIHFSLTLDWTFPHNRSISSWSSSYFLLKSDRTHTMHFYSVYLQQIKAIIPLYLISLKAAIHIYHYHFTTEITVEKRSYTLYIVSYIANPNKSLGLGYRKKWEMGLKKSLQSSDTMNNTSNWIQGHGSGSLQSLPVCHKSYCYKKFPCDPMSFFPIHLHYKRHL